MARVTVTGYTAERMLAIERSTVTGGRITGNNLVLTTRDGTAITAGSVLGPKGDRGEPGGVWDATNVLKGAVKLAGNIGGSADVPKVTGALEATVDATQATVTGSWTDTTTGATASQSFSFQQLLAVINRAALLSENAIIRKGRAKVLWSGSESEYLALPTAERNDPGFNAIVY